MAGKYSHTASITSHSSTIETRISLPLQNRLLTTTPNKSHKESNQTPSASPFQPPFAPLHPPLSSLFPLHHPLPSILTVPLIPNHSPIPFHFTTIPTARHRSRSNRHRTLSSSSSTRPCLRPKGSLLLLPRRGRRGGGQKRRQRGVGADGVDRLDAACGGRRGGRGLRVRVASVFAAVVVAASGG